MKIVVERHPDGFVAYPLGLKGVVVGQGDSFDEALADAGAVQRAVSARANVSGVGAVSAPWRGEHSGIHRRGEGAALAVESHTRPEAGGSISILVPAGSRNVRVSIQIAQPKGADAPTALRRSSRQIASSVRRALRDD